MGEVPRRRKSEETKAALCRLKITVPCLYEIDTTLRWRDRWRESWVQTLQTLREKNMSGTLYSWTAVFITEFVTVPSMYFWNIAGSKMILTSSKPANRIERPASDWNVTIVASRRILPVATPRLHKAVKIPRVNSIIIIIHNKTSDKRHTTVQHWTIHILGLPLNV